LVRRGLALQGVARPRLGRSVVDLEDVTMTAGTKLLLDHVTWHVGPGDRIGIVGVNGSGKTHLLRLLAGEIEPSAGTVKIGQTVHVGHLSQNVTELPSTLRVLEAVQEVRTTAELGGIELSAGQLAERFGFENEKQWTPVSDLSGGERRRLQLLRLLLVQPNVLLLDEPTNDLDTDTLAALEDLLDSWAGTLVVVSHDRYLLERVCDVTVALMGDGSLMQLPGGVDEYLTRRAASITTQVLDTRGSKGDSRAARKELTRLERRIATLDKREVTLHALLADAATDYAKAAELDAELREVIAEREAAEEAWLELSDD
jgi:ATP-binding cassette subfamily F protein uup